ncbi:MFS transporter [Lactobacillus salsicarnum]|uniref:MFS transporter n=2 Tax=Companilactobacillus mishanensis TaxID=2486008 RepID=A0A5P0ZJI8_9LACO|nr:MFS transporter [Companilactobacillus mishanensis]
MNKPMIVFAMSIGIFLCMLDTTIMNIALPAMQSGLDIPLNSLSWALNVYTILFATLTIPIGKLADIYGRNKIYLIGLIGFFVGSAICGLSPNLTILIIGRSIQSVSAAILFPSGMTIGISTSTKETRTKTIAALGITQGLASVLGPVIGGIVTQYFNWRWIFFINLPLVIITFILCVNFLQFKNETKISESIDWIGSGLSMIMLFTLVLRLIQGNGWKWNSPAIISLFAISITSLILFIFTERKSTSPMVDLKLFSNKQFNGAAVAILLSNLFLVGVNVILPTFFTKVENKTEFVAALLITPISLMVFIFSPIAALLIDRFGARIIISLGFISMAASYFLLFNIDPNNIYELVPACLLLGFGYGIIAGPIMVLAASDFEGSLLTASQSVTGVLGRIGITLAVAIFVSTLTSNITFEKAKSVAQAETITQKMNVPSKYQKDTFASAKKSINSGGGKSDSHISEKNVIAKESRLILEENNLLNAPTVVQAAVVTRVTRKVSGIFSIINGASKKIVTTTKTNIKSAYTDLYRNAFWFVLIAGFSGLLFEKRKA